MTVIQRFFIILTLASLGIKLFAQTDSVNFFSSPLNIPMYLAGNFGEIRPGHFHAGIDIKTMQVEGLPVLAAADGYVSRVKISLGGYGNALYITHPNGYTTVYGHLQRYNESITSFIRKEQYAKKRFTIELYFTPNKLPVRQGDTIALSGNSGASGGPHLHFEIRKTNGSIPVNPLKFGFKIKDNIHPILKNLAIYPINDTSLVNGKNKPAFIPLRKSGGRYVMDEPQKLSARGVIGFGIEAIDKLNGSNNRCGVYNITLKADSNIVYEHQMDAIGFDVTRFINTHIDYYQTKKNKRRIQKSFLTTHNKLNIYRNIQNKGLVYFSKYGHELEYNISDVYGNRSSFHFTVSVDTTSPTPRLKTDTAILFLHNKENSFVNDNIIIEFPAYSFYEDTYFTYTASDTITPAVALTHHILNQYIPLHKHITVSIRTHMVEPEVGEKYLGVSLTDENKILSPEGGSYNRGWVTFKTRSLGPYTIMKDTVPPVIRAKNFTTSNPNIDHDKELILEVEDELSGVKHFDAYIDDKWHLLQFDQKTGRLWINFDSRTPTKGNHTLVINVSDAVNNIRTFTFDFIW